MNNFGVNECAGEPVSPCYEKAKSLFKTIKTISVRAQTLIKYLHYKDTESKMTESGKICYVVCGPNITLYLKLCLWTIFLFSASFLISDHALQMMLNSAKCDWDSGPCYMGERNSPLPADVSILWRFFCNLKEGIQICGGDFDSSQSQQELLWSTCGWRSD